MGHGNRIIVIDPFPYQHRKYFDEERLRELGEYCTGWIEATIEIIDVEMAVFSDA